MDTYKISKGKRRYVVYSTCCLDRKATPEQTFKIIGTCNNLDVAIILMKTTYNENAKNYINRQDVIKENLTEKSMYRRNKSYSFYRVDIVESWLFE